MHNSFDDERAARSWAHSHHNTPRTTHPDVERIDIYTLAPEHLIEEERTVIEHHLKTCTFCRNMNARLRAHPEEYLAAWSARDPRAHDPT